MMVWLGLACVMLVVQYPNISAQSRRYPYPDKESPYRSIYRPKRYNPKLSEGPAPGRPLFLTPLIEAGRINEAQTLSRVRPDIGGVASYSGFLTVNKKCGSNMFFWYFPAQTHPDSAPLVTWLQGGPGSSSMHGLFQQVGPFNHLLMQGLKSRQFSWNVKNNLVFFDQPVGSGFSFTTRGCFVRNHTMVGNDMYNALLQLFKLFPGLQKNKFVLTGESFAGHYIPAIAYTIHKNNPTAKVKINLGGMMIGSGWTDPREQIGYAEYLYQIGVIEGNVKKEMEKLQQKFVAQVDKKRWHGAYVTLNTILAIPKQVGVNVYNVMPRTKDYSNWLYFIDQRSTRKAIHVGTVDFIGSSAVVYHHLKAHVVQSMKPQVEELLEHYPIVFYAGQVDVICGYPMMVHFLHSLSWSGQQQYLSSQRSLWFEGGELAGYIKGHHHLYDVMVRAAGHMVPADQPFWAYQLVNAFTSGNISSLISK